jgi:glycosyltransferase involved in cell wall biosynthesis
VNDTPPNGDSTAPAADAISVVIPAYNAEATLRRCIESVLGNGYAPLEIIIVDDASTDGTADLVTAMAKADPAHVRLVSLATNGGPARARNHGAEAAKYSYFFFLDSDTEMQSDALGRFAARIPDADAVCGHYHWRPLNDSPVAWYKSLLNYYLFSKQGVFEHDVFLGSAAGIRREAFEKTGGYDASLEWGMDYENEEFGHRLAKDHRILLDPSITVRHDFPGFGKLTSTYFTRVAQWMKLFMGRRKFEAGGPAAQDVGMASAALPVFLVSLLGLAFTPWAWALAALFGAVYLKGYIGFFGFVLTTRLGFLPAAVLLNAYFCIVISLGATWGAAAYLLGGRPNP